MRKTILYATILILSAASMAGCPTCIGRLELQSPAFFSDELYQLKPEDDVKELPKEKAQEKKSEKDSIAQDDEGDD